MAPVGSSHVHRPHRYPLLRQRRRARGAVVRPHPRRGPRRCGRGRLGVDERRRKCGTHATARVARGGRDGGVGAGRAGDGGGGRQPTGSGTRVAVSRPCGDGRGHRGARRAGAVGVPVGRLDRRAAPRSARAHVRRVRLGGGRHDRRGRRLPRVAADDAVAGRGGARPRTRAPHVGGPAVGAPVDDARTRVHRGRHVREHVPRRDDRHRHPEPARPRRLSPHQHRAGGPGPLDLRPAHRVPLHQRHPFPGCAREPAAGGHDLGHPHVLAAHVPPVRGAVLRGTRGPRAPGPARPTRAHARGARRPQSGECARLRGIAALAHDGGRARPGRGLGTRHRGLPATRAVRARLPPLLPLVGVRRRARGARRALAEPVPLHRLRRARGVRLRRGRGGTRRAGRRPVAPRSRDPRDARPRAQPLLGGPHGRRPGARRHGPGRPRRERSAA